MSVLNVLAIFFDDVISTPMLDGYHLNEMENGILGKYYIRMQSNATIARSKNDSPLQTPDESF